MYNESTTEYHFWRASDMSRAERPREALSHLQAALDCEPTHIQSLILAGEIYTLDAEELGVDTSLAYDLALQHFDRALAVEPKHADAWAGRAMVLLYMNRPEEALASAENGLFMLPLRIGYAMDSDMVHTNVAEALFRRKVEALLELCREDEARDALSAGLEYCPGSSYLTQLIERVMRLRPDTDGSR